MASRFVIRALEYYTDQLASFGDKIVATTMVAGYLIPAEVRDGFKRSESHSLDRLLADFDSFPSSWYLQNMKSDAHRIGVVPRYAGRVARRLVDIATRYKPPQHESHSGDT